MDAFGLRTLLTPRKPLQNPGAHHVLLHTLRRGLHANLETRVLPYVNGREQSTWFKIRNPKYSQWAGREELFERESGAPAPMLHEEGDQDVSGAESQ